MAVSADYRVPVQVNGYTCRNCTDVDYAKRHIDPQHPRSGPYGIDAAADPTRSPAVLLGGALAKLGDPTAATPGGTSNSADAAGRIVDLQV